MKVVLIILGILVCLGIGFFAWACCVVASRAEKHEDDGKEN